MNIVLHSDDLLLLDHWVKSLEETCVVIDDMDELKCIQNSLIILNYSTCSSKCEDILKILIVTNKVLILHRTPDIETAKYLLAYGVKGYGNAFMRGHFIVSAVKTIKENMIWLYPEFTTMLISEIPLKADNDNLEKLHSLSKREKEVALLLKDGSTYKKIAKNLQITPRTVKAHAGHIYKKLLVKDRLGLALFLK